MKKTGLKRALRPQKQQSLTASQIKVFEGSRGTFFKKSPWQGFGGSAPKVLPLGRRAKQTERGSTSSGYPTSQRGSLSRRQICRSRASEQREALEESCRPSAQAWGPRRSRTLPLATESGSLRERLGPPRSYRRSASLRQFENLAVSKLCGIVLCGWFGGARKCH